MIVARQIDQLLSSRASAPATNHITTRFAFMGNLFAVEHLRN